MRGLDGLRTLVTGAAGGIGSAVVQRLVEEGAVVAATDMRAPNPDGPALTALADITSETDVARLVARVRAELGGLDAVVAVAGIHATSPTAELDLATFRKVIEVSVVGTFLTCREALRHMITQQHGRIVTFGSTAAVVAAPGLASYAAAKGAVLQFTRSIAAEYARDGIRANCLCPGGTRTPLLAEIDKERAGTDHFLAGHPIGRYADPSEIAAAVAFLLSDDSSFVLGAALMADGGYTAT